MKIPGAQILHPGVGQQLPFYTVRGHARYNDTSGNTGQNLRWIGYIQIMIGAICISNCCDVPFARIPNIVPAVHTGITAPVLFISCVSRQFNI